MWDAVPGARPPRVLSGAPPDLEVTCMIVLGVILLLIGIFAKISILTTIGIILLVIGLVLVLLGSTGRAIGGRKHWF